MLRILEITNRVPYPLNDGGNIGVHYFLEGYLGAGCELSLLAMNTTRHWVDIPTLPSIYKRLRHFVTVRVDNRVKPVAAFKNLFSSQSYHITRFISKAFEAALVKLLTENTFDIIHLDGLYVSPYVATIRQHSKAKIVLRLHNPEFRIWERLAAQEKISLKRRYLRLLAKRLKSFELTHINDYDLVLALSEEDAAFYRTQGCEVPITIQPFGIDISSVTPNPKRQIQNPKFYHLGAMDWLPNRESVDWLLQNVWPLVMAKSPQARLYLAGRAMPSYYLESNWEGVEVVGEVPDADAFEKDKDVLLVPLLSGGGVRIKIYRGMAAGKAIITTPIGIEGIDARDGAEVLIAAGAEDFAAAILKLISQPEMILSLGAAARALVENKYNAPILMSELIERYNSLIGAR